MLDILGITRFIHIGPFALAVDIGSHPPWQVLHLAQPVALPDRARAQRRRFGLVTASWGRAI